MDLQLKLCSLEADMKHKLPKKDGLILHPLPASE